ncbi:MAG: GNAT family N-acetyltransferase [Lachnospiraceae bacterium]|nr:GNAT family N-acetyltransferase [Lachnospiraceae bacterium]
MEITYRKAERSDIEAVCHLVSCVIAEMERQNIFQWDSLYPVREDFLEDIKKGELFLGLEENQLVTIYTLNQECDEEYKDGNWNCAGGAFYVIHRLCVHPDYQNRGIGKSTLHYIESQVKEKYVNSIRLDVFEGNPFARKLYGNCGYQQVGYVDWRKGRFLLMEKEL